jgi:hypothetical protein
MATPGLLELAGNSVEGALLLENERDGGGGGGGSVGGGGSSVGGGGSSVGGGGSSEGGGGSSVGGGGSWIGRNELSRSGFDRSKRKGLLVTAFVGGEVLTAGRGGVTTLRESGGLRKTLSFGEKLAKGDWEVDDVFELTLD